MMQMTNNSIMQMMNNPMIRDIIQLRQQGVDAQTAMNQLSMRYPQFRNASAILQGKTPQEMDQTGRNALREYGIDLNSAMKQFNSYNNI